ncbi:MAG: CatB-related O-acetyltransferase [Nostoc sp. DedQUE08]|uniref:CatB-related O-acetyltransferase n=1 Tax=unclassified Nostoc TaxID=2593658 RepID=UPI002AD2A195|nr:MULTISPECIES: CatB-related O-acetyltransferase [unclassified Nostoc]MDZ8034056.1 CatB-related O-acetyltransferase [Nostoc sp. DedSLP04]MDZ8066677.1 CatB-related O-acetyltransferase [Nostoc sp. DedQUE08]MDZ8093511.1 CatB-related O-acetyltransferase [Nostoc sp. DedQUE05]MDZ8138077.1 CatB-related O-acetyltransferase [Nostoc sp. DedQUE04]
MAYHTYKSPLLWLASIVKDSRVSVGEYTACDNSITFALWFPDERIEIGKYCSLAKDITIFGGGEHHITRATTYPFRLFFPLSQTQFAERRDEVRHKGTTSIGNDVWIGYGATILSGVKIGNGAVIGSQAVVASDIPDYTVAVGNPAKVIRSRFRPETVERLLKLRWWDWDTKKVIANLEWLYQNPDDWPEDIQFNESTEGLPDFPAPELLEEDIKNISKG